MEPAAKVLIIDGYNFIHRARGGFQRGEHAVVYNFFRNLKALVEMFPSNRVIMVLEGTPKKRFSLFPDYKGNRKAPPADFLVQKQKIIDMLRERFPLAMMVHSDYECDDVVYNIIKHGWRSTEYTVASNDSDFTQLLNEFTNVRVYDPMNKTFVQRPDHDYVVWKALRGDKTDNVPPVEGFNDKRALEAAALPLDDLVDLLGDLNLAEQYDRNVQLIKFHDMSDDEMAQVSCSTPSRDWDAVGREFEAMAFKSMLNDTYWPKFQAVFDPLWGPTGV